MSERLSRRRVLGGFGAVMVSTGAARAAERLPRARAEKEGVAPGGVLAFVDAAEQGNFNLHSLMLLRRGKVVAEGWWAPYAPHLRHTLYSLSKSFTSTAVGLAAAEGRVNLEGKVLAALGRVPRDVTPHLTAMRVKHLLMMGTGHTGDSLMGGGFSLTQEDWVGSVLSRPLVHPPGTHFAYNNGATYLCSAIVHQATGVNVFRYLQPRLFAPLGIEGADWESDPRGISTGAWGLRVRTEDIARLGHLYLRQGEWQGRHILPEAWVRAATSTQIPNAAPGSPAIQTSDWAQGYGYQFWRCRHGAFRGDGAFGQYCVVLPQEEAVLAITAETTNMQAVLNAAWTHLLPALQGQGDLSSRAGERLRARLADLSLPLPEGHTAPPASFPRGSSRYRIEANSLGVTEARLQLDGHRCTLTLRDADGEHRVTCGLGRWLRGETTAPTAPLHLATTGLPGGRRTQVAGAAAFSDDLTLTMLWRFVETAHYQRVTCRLEGDSLRLEFLRSASILNPNNRDPRPALSGRLISA